MNGDGGRNSPFMETVGGRVSTDRESNKTRDDVISFKIDQSADRNSNKNIYFFFQKYIRRNLNGRHGAHYTTGPLLLLFREFPPVARC